MTDGMRQRLIVAKEATGYSIAEISRRSGVHKNTISMMLKEDRIKAYLETVACVAVAMGISPAWLAFGEGEMYGKSNNFA